VQRTFELQQVFRQTDAPFIAALAQIRMGTCDADAERLLRSRIGARLDEVERRGRLLRTRSLPGELRGCCAKPSLDLQWIVGAIV